MEEQKTERRPWGSFTNLDECESFGRERGFKVKRIEVEPGNRLSLQRHHNREEHWIVVKGRGVITLEDGPPGCDKLAQKEINVGSYVHVRTLQKHRLEAISSLVLIEVQIGICDEEDIERFSDDYGRAE